MTGTGNFYVIYDGPSLQNHEMDVRELAPALVALADLFERANEILSPDNSKITLNVKGSFKSGSFGIQLSVVHQIKDQILNFLQSDFALSAATLFSLIGISPLHDAIGLLQLIVKVAKGKIKKVTPADDRRVKLEIVRTIEKQEGKKTETLTETTIVDVDKRVLGLFKDQAIRKSVAQVIHQPLSKPGINVFQLRDAKNNEIITIGEEEKELFCAPEFELEELPVVDSEEYLQIVTISFKEDNKWRFTRGGETFYADILDKNFLEMVDQEKHRFGKKDLLRVTLRSKQFINKHNELDVSYSIVEVKEIRKSYIQMELPNTEVE